jgi:hypothetical protein
MYTTLNSYSSYALLKERVDDRSRRQICGAERVRTDDPRLAKPVLSQLSYSPESNRMEWAWVDSNHRPYAYQAYALTT